MLLYLQTNCEILKKIVQPDISANGKNLIMQVNDKINCCLLSYDMHMICRTIKDSLTPVSRKWGNKGYYISGFLTIVTISLFFKYDDPQLHCIIKFHPSTHNFNNADILYKAFIHS